MSSYPNDVGRVEIESVTLTDFNGGNPQDISHLIHEISIYESMSNYTISADIYVAEGIELLNNFPLRGEEFITFSIQTPNRKRVSYELFVESIQQIKHNQNSMMKFYVMRCVTRDFLTNSYTLFSKRYTDIDYDAAVNQVIRQDLGSGKNVKIEKTKGKFDYIVNNVRPLQVIDLIRERAVSGEKNMSSLFFFYEDHEGYNFTTLEKLITERKHKANLFPFSHDISNQASNIEEVINIRNILHFEVLSLGGSIKKIQSGRMSNQVNEFDLLHGTYYKKKNYNNVSDYKNYKATDEQVDFNSSSFNGVVSGKPSKVSMVVRDGTRPEMEHNNNIHLKRPFQERINQYSINARVYGDTELMVGDVINLIMPEISGVTREADEQKIYGGKYVVFTLNHSIVRDDNDGRFRHYMNFDLRKPNLRTGPGQ